MGTGSHRGMRTRGEKCIAWQVERTKNEWFQWKAKEVEREMWGGKGAWKGLREIQRERAGLRAVKLRVIEKCDGTPCVGKN